MMPKKCQSCIEKNERIRELEALLEATRLDADEAVASLCQVRTTLGDHGLDDVIEELQDAGVELPE